MENETTAKTATTEQPKVLTSPKLVELNAKLQTAWQEAIKHTDIMSDAAKAANMAVWNVQKEIADEMASLQKAENDAKIAELRNQRIALNTTQLDALAALNAEKAKKSPDAAKVAELETAFNTAKEVVENELLANVGRRSAKTSDGIVKSSGSRGEVSKGILEGFEAGLTYQQLRDKGFADGSIRGAQYVHGWIKNPDGSGSYVKKS